MYIDFAIKDIHTDEKQIKENIRQALEYEANSITLSYHHLKLCTRSFVDPKKYAISCFIDYPLGITDLKTRLAGVENAIMAGANTVDVTVPQILATNRKYDKIREDIREIKNICDPKNVTIRYIVEYRLFDHKCLKKICEIFDDFEIKYLFPSTGFFIDNLADNLIASAFLHQNSKEIHILASGNMWTDNHFDIVVRSGIHGIRTYSTHVMKNFRNYINS